MSLPLRAFDIDALYRVIRRLNWLAGHFDSRVMSKEFRKEGVTYTGTPCAISIVLIDDKGRQVDVAAEILRLTEEMACAIHPGAMDESTCGPRPRYVHPADRPIGPPKKRKRR